MSSAGASLRAELFCLEVNRYGAFYYARKQEQFSVGRIPTMGLEEGRVPLSCFTPPQVELFLRLRKRALNLRLDSSPLQRVSPGTASHSGMSLSNLYLMCGA